MNKKSFYGKKNTDPQLIYLKYQKNNVHLNTDQKFDTGAIFKRI